MVIACLDQHVRTWNHLEPEAVTPLQRRVHRVETRTPGAAHPEGNIPLVVDLPRPRELRQQVTPHLLRLGVGDRANRRIVLQREADRVRQLDRHLPAIGQAAAIEDLEGEIRLLLERLELDPAGIGAGRHEFRARNHRRIDRCHRIALYRQADRETDLPQPAGPGLHACIGHAALAVGATEL